MSLQSISDISEVPSKLHLFSTFESISLLPGVCVFNIFLKVLHSASPESSSRFPLDVLVELGVAAGFQLPWSNSRSGRSKYFESASVACSIVLPAAFQFRFLEHHRLTDFLHETDNFVCWPPSMCASSRWTTKRICRLLHPSSPALVRGITVAIRNLLAVARTLLRGLVNMEDGVRHVHGERHLSALQRKVANLSLC